MNDFADNDDEPRQIKKFDADFYQAMIDTLVQGAFVIEKKRFKLVNDAFCQLTGCQRSVLIGQTFDSFIFPKNIPIAFEDVGDETSVTRLQTPILKGRMKPEAPAYHLVVSHLSGSNTPIEINSRHFVDSEGNFYQIANVSKKKMEHALNTALRKSERDLQRLIEHFPSIYFQADSEGRVTRVSNFTAKLLGYENSEIAGKLLSELYVESEQHARGLAQVIQAKGEVVELEALLQCKGDESLPVSISSYAIYDNNRELVGIEVIAKQLASNEKESATSQTPLEVLPVPSIGVDVIRDPLTKLINQLAYREHLAKSIRSARRHQSQLWVLYLGLQNLPSIVNQFGQQVANTCLVHFSQRLQSFFRDTDIVARVSEDNFAVLLDDYTHELNLDELIERLHEAMDKRTTIALYPYGFSFDIGTANFPIDGINSEDLISHAESKMFKSKFSQTSQN
ncbi:MAG: sensor domain-containing diguanylate cyclase [Kangiellaceae bacterium]|nr:sensor domain-containing diguanylate cyclase [Kangiellaceae bacterium]